MKNLYCIFDKMANTVVSEIFSAPKDYYAKLMFKSFLDNAKFDPKLFDLKRLGTFDTENCKITSTTLIFVENGSNIQESIQKDIDFLEDKD